MNEPFSTKLWADAMMKEAKRTSFADQWLAVRRAEWDALPWHVKLWRRTNARCSEFAYRAKGAWRVLTGRADWE